MKIFVTYSTPSYFRARSFSAKMAKWFGKFDKIVLYSPNDIDDEFKEKHVDILNIKRGAGLWLWKPYSIYKALMEEAKEGDVVFYCDAASFFIRNVNYIVNTIDESDIWVSDNGFIEEQYTKEDTFQLMNCTDNKYKKTNQIQAQFFCCRKSNKSVTFVKEWLDCASDFNIIGPDNIKLGSDNCKKFITHRFDQSILSLLCKKNSIKPHLSPLYIDYPNKYAPYFVRNGEEIKHGEYPCIIVLQHDPTINIEKSLSYMIFAYLPSCIRNLLRRIKG